MFWKNWTKKQPKTAAPAAPEGKTSGRPSREDIIAQAKANAAAARAEIGDETLQKIKEAMLKKEKSAFEQAKRKVKAMDELNVRDEVRGWLKDK